MMLAMIRTTKSVRWCIHPQSIAYSPVRQSFRISPETENPEQRQSRHLMKLAVGTAEDITMDIVFGAI